MRRILRTLRGVLGNAMVWGVSWFVASFSLWTGLHFFTGFLPISDPWLLLFYLAAGSGVAGLVTGAAFSAYLRFAYWERSLLDIRVGRVALGGALVAGLVSLSLSLLSQAVSGFVLGPVSLAIGAIWPSALGAVTAAGSIRIAQHASRRLTGGVADELEMELRETRAMLGDGPG